MAENQITRDYEGMFLFGTAFTSNVEGAISLIRGFIEKHGGTIRVLKKWDDRKLAYEIAKQQRGLYVFAYFSAPTAAVANIERECRLSDDVLRALILDGSHVSVEEAEAMMPQQPEPRPERGGAGEGDFRGGRREEFVVPDEEEFVES